MQNDFHVAAGIGLQGETRVPFFVNLKLKPREQGDFFMLLRSLGEFVPFGRKWLDRYPHLVEDPASGVQVDFIAAARGLAQVRNSSTEPRYDVYPADDRAIEHIDLEDQLYVDGSTVIWSHDDHIVKSFKYDIEQQPVKLALFAWFPFKVYPPTDGYPTKRYSPLDLWDEDDIEEIGDALSVKATPMQFSVLSSPVDSRKRVHEDISDEGRGDVDDKFRGSNGNTVLRKGLCVVLHDIMKIHFIDGSSYSVLLPFPVRHACALRIGLLLEGRRDAALDAQDTPVMFAAIVSPVGVLEPVAVPHDSNSSYVLDASQEINTTKGHELVFAGTPRGHSKRQIVVTYNAQSNTHSIWLYVDKGKIIRSKQCQDPTSRTRLAKRRRKREQVERDTQASPSRVFSTTVAPLTRERSRTQLLDDFSFDTYELYGSEASNSPGELSECSGLYLRLLYEERPKRRASASGPCSVFLANDLAGTEILFLMKKREETLVGVSVDKLLDDEDYSDPVTITLSARAAVPVAVDNGFRYVILIRDNQLQMLLDPPHNLVIPIIPPAELANKISTIWELRDPAAKSFNVIFSDGKMERYIVETPVRSDLVLDSMAAIQCALSPRKYAMFMERFFLILSDQTRLKAGHPKDLLEWESFVITLLSFLTLVPTQIAHTNQQPIDSRIDDLIQRVRDVGLPSYMEQALEGKRGASGSRSGSFTDGRMQRLIEEAIKLSGNDCVDFIAELEVILRHLHIQFEEYRLHKLKRRMLRDLGSLLAQLAAAMGKWRWVRHYVYEGANPVEAGKEIRFTKHAACRDDKAPDLVGLFCYSPPSFSNPIKVEEVFGVQTVDPRAGTGHRSYDDTIKLVWSLYEALADGGPDKMIKRMVEEHHSRSDLNNVVDLVAQQLIDILEERKENPPLTWPVEYYFTIEREDIAQQLLIFYESSRPSSFDPNDEKFRLSSSDKVDYAWNMHEIMQEAMKPLAHKSNFSTSDMLNTDTEGVRFDRTGVLETVRTALDTTSTPEMTVQERPDLGDTETAVEHQAHVRNMVQRTMALPVGRGMFSYGTLKPELNKPIPVDPITLSVKLLPLRTVVSADEGSWESNYLDWPQFHSGVAAGLRVSPSEELSDEWIAYSMPDKLEAQHGGFLLGLGLNGNLRQLSLINRYRCLTQPCELAKAGFILGIAAAYRGTRDEKATKILSAHCAALISDGSAPLTDSVLIQSICLLGVGLVYMGSRDRRMTSAMIKEMRRCARVDISNVNRHVESCGLAAGFALGMMTLGSGGQSDELAHLKNELYGLMTSQHSNEDTHTDITSPGATIALGLMFLKTGNTRIAENMVGLERRADLTYVRPDMLLLRVIAKNLILWNTIRQDDNWIKEQLPEFLRGMLDRLNERTSQAEAQKQAMYNIVAGACLSMGLRFAGANDPRAFACLLSRLDWFMKLSNAAAVSFQQRVTKSIIRTCVDVTATAAAMVVAGTGNAELLKRLNQLRERVGPHMSYGDHMATHMAMGLLFTGIGGYTLKNSNEAIACLLAAFYPFYPASPDDNRFHTQAFRHLWALALEVRWLTTFDVESNKPCEVPIELQVYEDEPWIPERTPQIKEIRLIAPAVIPPYHLVKSIKLDSPHYFPLRVQMDNSKYQRSVINSGTLYIKRRRQLPA